MAVRGHPHPEAASAPGHGLPDPPEADDPEQGSPQLRPQQVIRLPAVELAGTHGRVALDDPPCRREQQGHGEVGGGVGQHARGVADGDSPPGGGGDVHVVVPDRVDADPAQGGHPGVEDARIDHVDELRAEDVDGIGAERGAQLGVGGNPAQDPERGGPGDLLGEGIGERERAEDRRHPRHPTARPVIAAAAAGPENQGPEEVASGTVSCRGPPFWTVRIVTEMHRSVP